MHFQRKLAALAVVAVGVGGISSADAACCFFVRETQHIEQPGQKVFITWDPVKKLESFTVQPKFEGDARDFGMVVPTPSQPKLDEMPRDFFKNLAVYSILMQREFPQSKLVTTPMGGGGAGKVGKGGGKKAMPVKPPYVPPPPTIVILEEGVVGSLDYKIISADRSDDLFQWLKINRFQYFGDEETLNFYVRQKWVFTVMQIDALQMKKVKTQYAGDVAPMRFQFSSDKLIYPLKITQHSVKDKTEALFYVQAPHKVDLQEVMSYQQHWVPLLESSSRVYTFGNLPGRGSDWLTAIGRFIPDLDKSNRALGFQFTPRAQPVPNAQGRTPTVLEWARKLTAQDIAVLQGSSPYSEKVPDVDEGFTADKFDAKEIRARLAKALEEHPKGYLVRYVPPEDIKGLLQLVGHLHENQWITRFRKTFRRDEMNADLLLVPARMGNVDDFSEYTEILPTSPPQHTGAKL